jgi:hypothetical protein
MASAALAMPLSASMLHVALLAGAFDVNNMGD